MDLTVALVAVAVVVAVLAWFLINRRHPEAASGHDHEPARRGPDELYGGADRPAGPDAESMRSPDRSPPAPRDGS